MNLSGRLIDAFLALEETGRFSLAAQRCHVSPPAFSQMIARLEEKVGARLFDRNTRSVSLTSEGEVFSRGAHRIADEMNATVNELRDRGNRIVGRVTVAAPPSLSAHWLPRQFALYRDQYPGIALRLHDMVSDRILDMVAAGDADFGFNAIPGNDLEFEVRLLMNERMFILCRSGDILAERPEVSLEEVANREFSHIVHAGSVWQLMQPLLRAAGGRDSGQEVSQLGTLTGLVANGFGVSIIPSSAVQLCQRPGVVAVPINDPKAVRPIYMVKRRNRSLSAAAEAMWQQLSVAASAAGFDANDMDAKSEGSSLPRRSIRPV